MWANFSGSFSGCTRRGTSKAQASDWRLCSALFANTVGASGRKRSSTKERRFSSRSDGRTATETGNQNLQSGMRSFMSPEVEILLVDDSAEDVELTALALHR